MTATDELRRMLDERGVEWEDCGNGSTYVEYRGEAWRFDYDEPFNQLGIVCFSGYTPAQAIEATLGRGECRDVCNGTTEFICSACGFDCDLTSWISLFDGDEGRRLHHHYGAPRYCPNCGRKVVGE